MTTLLGLVLATALLAQIERATAESTVADLLGRTHEERWRKIWSFHSDMSGLIDPDFR
jgi:hypothetical protein